MNEDLKGEDVPVREKVYEVARHVEAIVELTKVDPAFHFAEMVRDAYRDHGQDDKAVFWQEVKDFLFMQMCTRKGSRIIIELDDA